jgi:hypothetical protein
MRKTDWLFLAAHAVRQPDGGYKCKKTGAFIQTVRTGRSIWWGREWGCAGGGGGEVRYVDHLWCPSCGVQPQIKFGKPIYEDELWNGAIPAPLPEQLQEGAD